MNLKKLLISDIILFHDLALGMGVDALEHRSLSNYNFNPMGEN
jgi:hypothetical protein